MRPALLGVAAFTGPNRARHHISPIYDKKRPTRFAGWGAYCFQFWNPRDLSGEVILDALVEAVGLHSGAVVLSELLSFFVISDERRFGDD